MPYIVNADGFESFINILNEYQSTVKHLFVLFSGSVDASTQQNWCPDCEKAAPVVQKGFSCAPESSVLIYVQVGGRDFWHDPNNIFRTDPRTRVASIPTLIKFGTPLKLEERQCAEKSLVEMLFQEDD